MAFMTSRLFKFQVLISINRVQKESISNKLDQPNWTNINRCSKIRRPVNFIKKSVQGGISYSKTTKIRLFRVKNDQYLGMGEYTWTIRK